MIIEKEFHIFFLEKALHYNAKFVTIKGWQCELAEKQKGVCDMNYEQAKVLLTEKGQLQLLKYYDELDASGKERL